MMRVLPCDEPNACGGEKRSRPSTCWPRFARWYAAALPIAPRPTMMTSKFSTLHLSLFPDFCYNYNIKSFHAPAAVAPQPGQPAEPLRLADPDSSAAATPEATADPGSPLPATPLVPGATTGPTLPRPCCPCAPVATPRRPPA